MRRTQDPLAQLTGALSRSPLENLQRTLASLSDMVDDAIVPGTAERAASCNCEDDHHGAWSCSCGAHARHHKHGGDCDRCGSACDCHCRCCVGDVDLVIYSRVGERRIVPITVQNPRKRSKHVNLELSGWETQRNREDIEISAKLDRTELDLEPCSAETVVLSVATNDQSEGFEDVGECIIHVADLRMEGCGIRPVRIALALLPRDCDSYEASCDCGCC